MYNSPSQSTTSLSDVEDEEFNKSTFLPSDPVTATPAQWSRQLPSSNHLSTAPSLINHLSHASRLPPEILIHILKHLHSSRDVYHALLVCRIWCECSVELLWHRPSFSKLSTVVKMIQIFSRPNPTFPYARFIRRLNFLYLASDLNDGIFSRLAQCVRLERLTLINCKALTDGALARVLPCCPNMVALDLTGVVETSDRAIVALASSTKRLQGVNLGGCKKLTDRAVLALAANCPLLRRVKLSHVELITDEALSALAKACPLLLEIDLNNCKRITDVSVRDLWLYSNHLRELRLSYCVELTDAAFPSSPKSELPVPSGPNPFPQSDSQVPEKLPPLRLSRPFDHLRMLDLTGCSHLTDEAIDGIISVAHKIRNLVLAKCNLLTDNAVESICTIGKHLHYLHLGHAGSITDWSIRLLARACTRLRYIDLANCVQLTDMSVFELASLQKLKRIGLVRVRNLTDQAIYSLGERHASLERIHLSYCDQITVLAINFLLQKLSKLTHLSLTGIPAFRRPELQQFCRDPPSDFNAGQRAAFCVYSGKGVSELRDFLTGLLNSINDEMDAQFERQDGEESGEGYTDDMEIMNDGDDDDEDDEEIPPSRLNVVVSRGGYRSRMSQTNRGTPLVETTPIAVHPPRELMMTRERGNHPTSRNGTTSPQSWANNVATPAASGPSSRRSLGFGQQPIIEASASPTPSEVASNRSSGTNRSSGAGFFRNYREPAGSTRQGIITPDLVYAEIGHGRGMEVGPSIDSTIAHPLRKTVEPLNLGSQAQTTIHPSSSSYAMIPSSATSAGSSGLAYDADSATYSFNSSYLPASPRAGPSTRSNHDRDYVLADSSNSYHHSPPHSDLSQGWVPVNHQSARSSSSSPDPRGLHDSVESTLSTQAAYNEGDSRGRSVKRGLRGTITAAEQYASSFFFGCGSNGGPEGASGPSNKASDPHGH